MSRVQGSTATPERVREMFDEIAPRYDMLNRVLSLNIAALWWRKTARHFDSVLRQPDACVLDLCCGTGSMTSALLRRRPAGAQPVLALDFSRKMLDRGWHIFDKGNVRVMEADAMQLPLEDNSLHLVVSAFGFRNLPDYDRALAEVLRVLKPGCTFGILEANEPPGLFGRLYGFYFHHVLPRIGAALSGAPRAYRYLPASVRRFPQPAELKQRALAAGFSHAQWHSYTFGTAGLYCFTK